jgi:hypothetical protein
MLATQGMPQQGNLYPNPQQPQFNRSPNIQTNQLGVQPQNPNATINHDTTAQQLEQWFRMNPEENGNRAQALTQLMLRAKQNGGAVNMGSLSSGQQQPQQQQQQQRPHPVGLNGFNPQAQGQAPPQPQHQRAMSNQSVQQMPQQQQQSMPPQQPQMPRSDSYNIAAQQNMQYPNPVVDTQRQIEAVSLDIVHQGVN